MDAEEEVCFNFKGNFSCPMADRMNQQMLSITKVMFQFAFDKEGRGRA